MVKKTEIDELRDYRRLKASGRLIIIPEDLKDGDTVWVIADGRVSSHMIVEWIVVTGRLFGKVAIFSNESDYDYLLFAPEDIGVSVFSTKEEADAAYEAMTKDPEEEEMVEEATEDVSDNG